MPFDPGSAKMTPSPPMPYRLREGMTRMIERRSQCKGNRNYTTGLCGCWCRQETHVFTSGRCVPACGTAGSVKF